MKRLLKSFVVVLFSAAILAACGGGGGGGGGVGGDGPAQYLMGGALQGKELALIDAATTVAGQPLIGSADGTGTTARFYDPTSITTDGTNLYVSDTGNSTIRKIVISTGAVTTFAGTAGSSGSADGTGKVASFNVPRGIATDGTNLYVTDTGNNTIRKIVISTGVVTTLAGTAGSSGSADGTGSAARFNEPFGITTDGTNLYVADTRNNTIRKIVISTGQVTTIAGMAGASGSADGPGPVARFYYPWGITTDGKNLYVADTRNNTIRKIVISNRAVTTFAGTAGLSGSTDSTGPAASFLDPANITTDGTYLYVADEGNSEIRKIVISTRAVTTIAGTAGSRGSADGTSTAARFDLPWGITTDGTNLYVADEGNSEIRQIVISTGAVTTIAGTAGSSGSTDGTGPAARFNLPFGITTDGTNLYVADEGNNTIRKIVISTGAVTTIAGTAGSFGSADGTGPAARFNYPFGITTDGTNLYVADTGNSVIRKIVISTGAVTTIAGTAGSFGSADGTGPAARFIYPFGITTDGTNLYVADKGNNIIRKIVISTGAVTTIAGTAGLSGSTDGTGPAATFSGPTSITTDGTNLYVADTGNSVIRKIVISTGAVTTIAGTAGLSGSTDGTGPAATFSGPTSITTDGTNLYVADTGNSVIRKIVISTGAVTTIAGTAGLSGSTDDTGPAATFNYPSGITTDGTNLYVADEGNNTIRRIQ